MSVLQDNGKMVWELDNTSGSIAVDSYIVNFLEFNNASHVDEVFKKVDPSFIEERLVALKNSNLEENFIGVESEMANAINAFENEFLRYKSKIVKGV